MGIEASHANRSGKPQAKNSMMKHNFNLSILPQKKNHTKYIFYSLNLKRKFCVDGSIHLMGYLTLLLPSFQTDQRITQSLKSVFMVFQSTNISIML